MNRTPAAPRRVRLIPGQDGFAFRYEKGERVVDLRGAGGGWSYAEALHRATVYAAGVGAELVEPALPVEPAPLAA